jgi:hypothetical protein
MFLAFHFIVVSTFLRLFLYTTNDFLIHIFLREAFTSIVLTARNLYVKLLDNSLFRNASNHCSTLNSP